VTSLGCKQCHSVSRAFAFRPFLSFLPGARSSSSPRRLRRPVCALEVHGNLRAYAILLEFVLSLMQHLSQSRRSSACLPPSVPPCRKFIRSFLQMSQTNWRSASVSHDSRQTPLDRLREILREIIIVENSMRIAMRMRIISSEDNICKSTIRCSFAKL